MVATTAAILGAAAITAGAQAGIAEEGRKSASKAATKARQLMKVDESPVAIPETGGSPLDALKRRKKRSGRAATIQAGSLIPESTGTKSLLG